MVRYALRTAGFALLYAAALIAGHLTDMLFWPSAAVAPVWLLAQARFGRRGLDIVALSVVAVLFFAAGDPGVLSGAVRAVAEVLPAVLFALAVDRWLPGWWQHHGDRFRRSRPTMLRLLAIAAASAVAAGVLRTALAPADIDVALTLYGLFRDTVTVGLTVLAARTLLRPADAPPGLTIVR